MARRGGLYSLPWDPATGTDNSQFTSSVKERQFLQGGAGSIVVAYPFLLCEVEMQVE